MKKKKWSKPECKRVKLMVEEAVITGCKIPSAIGPARPNCKDPQNAPCSSSSS